METITIGDVALDRDYFEVRVKGKPVHLTRREYDLLEYFMLNPNRVIPVHELLSKVWKYKIIAVETRTPFIYISYLRKKIGYDFLESKPGFGYRINPAKL